MAFQTEFGKSLEGDNEVFLKAGFQYMPFGGLRFGSLRPRDGEAAESRLMNLFYR